MTGLGIIPSGTICPQCSQEIVQPNDEAVSEARRRIQELEAQVRYLSSRAAQTAEKLADYEDEIHQLQPKAEEFTESKKTSVGLPVSPTSFDPAEISGASCNTVLTLPPPPSSHSGSQHVHQGQHATRISAFASFLPYRRGATTATSSSATLAASNNSDTTSELQNALSREQALRKAAENQLSQAHSELEELTVQLFSQANEMVAQERKARVKLEDRVAVLERRDGEKRKRLDRLEKAIERVERVRGMIG